MNRTLEELGKTACDYELIAADERLLPLEREYYRGQAQKYRDKQTELLTREYEESLARPYPLANVLPQDRRPPMWVWVFAIAVGLGFALLLWL